MGLVLRSVRCWDDVAPYAVCGGVVVSDKMKVHFSSETDDWATPQAFFDECNKKYGPFFLDVCAHSRNNKCAHYFSIERGQDALQLPWKVFADGGTHTNNCWMNPPYGEPKHPCKTNCKKKLCEKRGHHSDVYVPGIIDWVKKAYEESLKGCLVVCLLPARTDTKWFHDYCTKGNITFIKGRLKFGGAKNSAPFPSMLVVFGYKDNAVQYLIPAGKLL